MTNSLIDTLNSAAKLFPGGEIALRVALASTSGAAQGAAWLASEFAKIGKSLAGRPGEISAALFGAGTGAMGGFLLGPLLNTRIGLSTNYDPGYVPQAAHSVSTEEVFSLFTVGQGKFGDNPQYTEIQMKLYDLSGRECGSLNGLQLNRQPPPQLFQAPPPPQGAIDHPPVPQQEVAVWTNGLYTFVDGSTIITEGMARSFLVPQQDKSLLFMVTNSHVITEGTGVYEGVQGIKQGTGAVFVPPGEFPGKFPAPGYEFLVNTIDTFRLIKKSFLHINGR
jgi:hypothetical protein